MSAEPPNPEDRARPGAAGTAVEVAGSAWLFAAHVPGFEPVWDRLYDQNAMRRCYDVTDLRAACVRLLWANYELSPDEVLAVVRAAAVPDLVRAAEAALFGPAERHATYSDWVAGSLWANGVDPDEVPPAALRAVLETLVATGRAVPPQKYISSLEAAAKFESFRRMIPGGGR